MVRAISYRSRCAHALFMDALPRAADRAAFRGTPPSSGRIVMSLDSVLLGSLGDEGSPVREEPRLIRFRGAETRLDTRHVADERHDALRMAEVGVDFLDGPERIRIARTVLEHPG